jgi:hypothetical protein
MVRVCCFCDKVRNDAIGLWQEHRGLAPACASGPSVILSYTCCHQCFEADPDANVFRARQRRSSASVYGIGRSARSPRYNVLRAAS